MTNNAVARYLVFAILISSCIPGWQYNVGIGLITHHLFSILFILWILIGVLVTGRSTLAISRPVKTLLTLYTVFFIWKVISIVGVGIYSDPPDQFAENAVKQYMLGVTNDFFVLILFYCLGVYFTRITAKERKRYIGVFVAGIIVSCLYQYVSLYVMIVNDIDLDEVVWPAISYNLPADFPTLRSQALGLDGTDSMVRFFRAGGFSINPNGFAAILICVIPYLVFNVFRGEKKYLIPMIITLVSLGITFSRSGWLAVGFALGVLALMNANVLLVKHKVRVISFCCGCAVLISMYAVHVIDVVSQRGVDLGLRADLREIGLLILSESPIFGVGHNASSVALLGFAQVVSTTGADLHNLWLAKAVELGVVGLVIFLLIQLYICWVCVQKKNLFSIALISSLLGLSLGGFFNNALAGFTQQLFIILFFCTAVIGMETRLKNVVGESRVKNIPSR